MVISPLPSLWLYQYHSVVSIYRHPELDNPVFTDALKPSLALNEIFNTYGVNFFLTSMLGHGLQESLLSKGIHIIYKDHINREVILKLFDIQSNRI